MLSIGELSKRTGVKVPTIRYYEQMGLIREADRSEGNQRRYEKSDLERLAFIRHARQLGFSVEAIRNLLDLSDNPERPCGEANALAARQLDDVEAKIAQLETLRGELQRMVAATCDGRAADCRVIEALAG